LPDDVVPPNCRDVTPERTGTITVLVGATRKDKQLRATKAPKMLARRMLCYAPGTTDKPKPEPTVPPRLQLPANART